MKKMTTEEFIQRSKAVHGDKYDYSLIKYKNTKSNVTLICKDCGKAFEQNAGNHLNGAGCNNCRRLTQEEFIKKAKEIHGDKFDYSPTVYTTRRNNILVKCRECGEVFSVRAGHLLDGQGCPKCWQDRLTTEKYIARAKEKFHDRYDYTDTVYVNARTKIKFVCPIHGAVEQNPMQHLNGFGCPKCEDENQRATTIEFIEKAREVHGDLYDYSLVNYTTRDKKVKIICKKHGVFEQKAGNHLSGYHCPHCSISRGEEKIKEWLNQHNIKFKWHYPLRRRNKKKGLSLIEVDFFVPSVNIIIEYNGEQHYEPIEIYGGEEQFEKQQARDREEERICKEQKINLLVIPYTDYDNINQILKERLLPLYINSKTVPE